MGARPTTKRHEIPELMARGKFRKVVDAFLDGQDMTVEELHSVFVAYIELKAPAWKLAVVYEEASKKTGFEEVLIDFLRDWALHALEVENNLPAARERINEVRAVGGTDLQRVLGRLADGKITFKEGYKEEALSLLSQARTMAYALGMPAQVIRDCNWWYTILLSESGEDVTVFARVIQKGEPKLLRRAIYLLLAWLPKIGHPLARQVFKRY